MAIKVNCTTEAGGSVEFGDKKDAWASYAVAGANGEPPPEHFYAGIKLKNGKRISLFVNRETGLVVLDAASSAKSNVELVRKMVV